VASNQLLLISSSVNVSLENIIITNFAKTAIKVLSSEIILVENLLIKNCSHAIEFKDSNIEVIDNSTFEGNGGQDVLSGGALKIIDSSLQINHSHFIDNTAHSGGAIFFT